MHQYLVQSRTNPLTKRAAASVIVEAATTATGRDTTARSRPSSSRPSPPRPSPLPPLDPSSSQNPTNSRLRSLLSSGLASSASAKNANTNSSQDSPKDGGGGGDDATTEDMTNSYPISNDGASTISSLSSGSGRRAAYRSLVHFLPSLLPMPPPPSSQQQMPPPPPPPPQASQPSDQQQPAAGGESLHDLNVSGISYQSSQTGGTARKDGRLHGNGGASFRDRPTPVRSGSRPRDQVGLDPDGPIMGRRAKVQGGDEEGAATATAINEKRSPQYNQQRYDDSDDSETLGSLVTAEEEDGDNDTHADSAAAGFYPVGRMQQHQHQQQQPYQRQSQVQKRSDDSVGSNNVARDILSKYGQGKGGNNVTKPTERASSDPPVDATSTSAGSSLPRQSPNGTRHSASLRMKARSRSPASKRSHPHSSPTASKSESHLANGGKNQGLGPDPVPSSSDPSSSATNPSDRGVGAKQGGIAARIAMFEKNNASTPPSTPPKPRTNTKRWTPPNDIPNPRVQPGAPSPTSKQATSSSIDDESIADASFASRASSIPFDEKIDRGMRTAVSTVSTTTPIPEQKELVEEEDNDDGWRERMITGQRHVAPKDTTVSSGNSNLVGSSDQSRSVSPRKPNWQRAASSPDRHGNIPEGKPQDKTDTNEQPLAAQNRGARGARLARHRLRQRSKSPQKAEAQAQAEELPSDASSSEEQTSRASTKSIFSPPVSGNRVR